MSRERKILDHLDTMAGPLGPFVSLDEWERERTTWAQRLSREDVGILVELLYHPPQGWSEGAEYEAVTALSTRGQCDRLWFLELARMTFARLGANAGLIEALGAAAPPGATDLLIDLGRPAPHSIGPARSPSSMRSASSGTARRSTGWRDTTTNSDRAGTRSSSERSRSCCRAAEHGSINPNRGPVSTTNLVLSKVAFAKAAGVEIRYALE